MVSRVLAEKISINQIILHFERQDVHRVCLSGKGHETKREK